MSIATVSIEQQLAQIEQIKAMLNGAPETPGVAPTPFADRASILVKLGIPVAPVQPREKACKLPGWEQKATTDVETIRQWGQENPDFNTAAVARAELGGFCFFEVDAANFHLEMEKQTGHKFPETFTVSSTPGRGKGHFYFRSTPASIALHKNVISGKDENGKEAWSFRINNAYVVGPLSVKADGTVYTVVKDAPIADCPDWLVSYCATKTEDKKTGHSELDSEEPIIEGARNNSLTSIVGRARQVLAMDKEQLLAYALSVNEKRCRPPLPESEVRTIVGSIGSKPVKPAGKIEFPETPAQPQVISPIVEQLETESINPSETITDGLDFLPGTALASTRLQDIYMEHFQDAGWPLTLAFPALVTAASVVIPFQPRGTDSLVFGDDVMTNLYTALIAGVHVGKSRVAEWAGRAIGVYDDSLLGSHYFEGKWGSAEQMLKSLHKKQGTFTSRSVLISPDEWSHLFSKAAIPDASFPTVLTTSFYRRNQFFTLGGPGGGREYNLNLAMSFIGGIVEEDFDTVFGSHSLGGLYDRFLFGRAPNGFKWSYQPCSIPQGKHFVQWGLKPVQIDGSVYEVTKQWSKENPGLGRIAEICTRIAVIYGSLDGRPEITGKDIEPLKSLALYQVGLRQMFRPNPGQNPDAVFANKALAWIQKHAGEWASIAKLKQHTWRVEQNLGPAVAVRSLIGLAKSGRIELWLPESGRDIPKDYHGPLPRIGLVRRVK